MKKLMSLALALLMTVFLAACGSAPASGSSQAASASAEAQVTTSSGDAMAVAPVLDISLIAGENAAEVESVLGVPTTSEIGSFDKQDGTIVESISKTYADGTEITFIGDIAARITVYPPDGSKVEDGAALIGLTSDQAGTASYNGVEDYSWSDNTEYYSITAFNNGDGTISYIYVVTSEEYQ
ncbi:hypothetical protein QVN85_01885 [Oscillibacter valericigenes]|nr:hypothetical protein [Oscillibacter valericigenes]